MVMIITIVGAFLFDHLLCAQHASRCFTGIRLSPPDISVGAWIFTDEKIKAELPRVSGLGWCG